MKKLILFPLFALGLFFQNLAAQSAVPQGFSYQAIVRNASGGIAGNTEVKFIFRILNANGSLAYSEEQTKVTNEFGLANLTVGSGTPTSGQFSNVSWTTGDKKMNVKLAVPANNMPVDLGEQSLMSVPYALYAGADIAIFEEQKNLGNDFTGTVGTYTKRLLNIEVLSSPSVQLTANNEIKFLQPGTYVITASAYTYRKGSHKLVLRKVGGNQEVLLEGTTEFNGVDSWATNRSFIMGKLTVSTSDFTCILDHYTATPNEGTFGNGISAPGTTHETYSQIMIQKVK